MKVYGPPILPELKRERDAVDRWWDGLREAWLEAEAYRWSERGMAEAELRAALRHDANVDKGPAR